MTPTHDPDAFVAGLVSAWCDLDRADAVLPADGEIIEASQSLRSVILEFALAGGIDEELYDACALLGRQIAQRGGSPTLASLTMDHARDALSAAVSRGVGPEAGEPPLTWLTAARAAVAEGFTYALLERVREDALRSWDFPNCTVSLPDSTIAVAAGLPSDDPELLADWAGGIARAAALQGVRRAFVTGPHVQRAAVEDALGIVGIEVSRRR